MSDDVNVTVGEGDTISVAVGGEDTASVTISGQGQEVYKRDTFIGDGSTTDFPLPVTPKTTSERVYVQGVLQDKDTEYSISGKILSFNSAPGNGRKVEVHYAKS